MWCLPLHHAADNQLVLPTHCISPHHLQYLPLLLPGAVCFSSEAPMESSSWKICVGEREVTKGLNKESIWGEKIIDKPPAARPQQWRMCDIPN